MNSGGRGEILRLLSLLVLCTFDNGNVQIVPAATGVMLQTNKYYINNSLIFPKLLNVVQVIKILGLNIFYCLPTSKNANYGSQEYLHNCK